MKTLPTKLRPSFDQILSYEGQDDLEGNCLLKNEAVEPAILSLEFQIHMHSMQPSSSQSRDRVMTNEQLKVLVEELGAPYAASRKRVVKG